LDMPVPVSKTHSEPSTVRNLPHPIHTQLPTDGTLSSDGSESPPSIYDPSVIPPTHDFRTLVLCFDGTGDQFDADNSNIVELFSMLKKDDKSQQLVYYQAGIGTYNIPEIATPFWSKVHKKIDMAFGNHLDAHVMGGYEFLMENYHAEDKICIFGFSRGAYTARALAGMIQKVGLLPAGNHQQVPFAYKMFSQDDDAGWKQSTVFKKAFSVDVEIELVGVWDTVCSVGLIPHTLPFTASNTAVRFFRHAISLDEHRAKFKPSLWHRLAKEKGTKIGEMPRSNHRHPHYHLGGHHHDHKGKLMAQESYNLGHTETHVKEVWFAGCHCDIGGGSVPNGTRNSLARIPLRWMIRECFKINSGIQFHREAFKDIGIDPSTLYPLIVPRPPPLVATESIVAKLQKAAKVTKPSKDECEVQASPTAASTFRAEEDEELADAVSKVYDELKISWGWWILEYLPLRHRAQNRHDATWVPYWLMNRGLPRTIPKAVREKREKIHVHRSVKMRMEAEGLEDGKYEPKMKFGLEDCEWVD